MTQGGIVASLVFGLACVGCGGSAPPAAAPSAAPSSMEPPPAVVSGGARPAADAPAGSSAGRDVAPEAAPAMQPPPPPPPESATADRERGVATALRDSRADLSRAQRDLEASMSDCRSACHALASMERATGHVCSMATDHDDRRTCEDAKTTVLRARDRIRASCGTCPDGASLDRTAPIPSRP